MRQATTKTAAARPLLQAAAHHAPRMALALLFTLPLLLVLSASLRQVGAPPPRGIEWLPKPLDWTNYLRIFDLVPLGRQIANSLFVAAIAVPLTLVTASWAGLGMALLPRAARHALVVLTVMLLVVPTSALWLARFQLFKHLGLLDTRWALVAPAVMGTSPLFVLLYYRAFSRIPAALYDAARLDGANHLQLWTKIAMPLAWPTTFAVATLAFALYWSDIIAPLLFLKSERLATLPVGLQTLHQLDITHGPLLMAGVVIMVMPVLALFFVAQRLLWPEYDRSPAT